MLHAVTTTQPSDAELIAAARKGDSDAYGELYVRHLEAAHAAARALTRSRTDADDVVSEAFARVLRALQGGGGPDVSFRPYLVTAVRNVFYDRVRRSREAPTEDMADVVNETLIEAARNKEEGALAAVAFASLPERWQLVLWHTEVEGRSASEVAPLLGLAPNAVAALAYRAREGLRQAYLQAHLREQREAACRACAANLGAYVRDGLATRDRHKVEAHLETCPSCQALVDELTNANTTLRAALLPILLGVSSAAYLSGFGSNGLLGWFGRAGRRLPKRPFAAATASGTAAGVTAGVAASVALAVAVFASGGLSGSHRSRTDAVGEGRGTGTGAPEVTIVGTTSPVTTSPVTTSPATAPVETTSPVTVPVTTSTMPATTAAPAAGSTTPATTTPLTVAVTAPPVTTRPTVAPTTPATVASTVPATTAPNPSVPATTTATTATTTAPATTAAATTAPATTAPATTAPSTTAPPTTAVVVPPHLSAVASQRSAAIAGGDVRIAVAVTNLGSDAVTGIRLEVPAPAGTRFTRVERPSVSLAMLLRRSEVVAPGWSCSAAVSCTLADLGAGETSTVVLTFTLSPTVEQVTFQPTLPEPAGADVTVEAITVAVTRVPGVLVAETTHGAVQAIGNSVVTCEDRGNCAAAREGKAPANDHGGYRMRFVNTAGGKFNSSSADLDLDGTVSRAFLVWAGDTAQGESRSPHGENRDTITFVTPKGSYTITGSAADAGGGVYTAWADVTDVVAGDGTYAVADVQTTAGQGTFGGWSLVVVVHDQALPERLLVVTTPAATLAASSPWSLSLPGPAAATTADVVAVAFEGDPDSAGDALTVGGTTIVNPFRSAVPGARNPADVNTFGTDVTLIGASVPAGPTLTLGATTTNDRVQLALVAVALAV